MYVIHFVEDKKRILTQFVQKIPSVDDQVKIKGKKAKVIRVEPQEQKQVDIHIVTEKIVKKNTKEPPKKRR
ncbi:hypothetical protein M3182_00740 [Mesobacillus maritimus]|uniref:hypothetical protein n=1 Tax=Mesobacillus maritimus TaxID=1643336 RepID=UPI002040C0E8|nr:hypothetical protein [Mesobacillus maritimus]MCM3584266.1 hypothetical protein [Mesobacillus maritimus]MCM3669318.1 hypothetical protein [Mesobacillus maritimus]